MIQFGEDNNKKKEISKQLTDISLAAQEREAMSLSKKLGLEYQNLTTVPPQTQAIKLLTEEEARAALCVAFILKGKIVGLACNNPQILNARKVIERLKNMGHQVKIFIVSKNSLLEAWKSYKLIGADQKKITGKIDVSEKTIEDLRKKISNLKDLKKEVSEFSSPFASQLLEILLAGALIIDASDIHMEAGETISKIRYRIDGALHDISDVSPKLYNPVVSRVKLLGGMKINVKSEAQDGRFTIRAEGMNIEIRVSIIPSSYGETVVMRVLNPKSIKLELESLGFRPDDLEIINNQISRPNGIILNTGPTGSGKTTTLYAFLRRIYRPEIKIITVEDPVEYHLEGITQTQVSKDKDYTFANGLRSILRQDPDVILVGEIRDGETASIAMQASLTGHLVLSTLHTNSAAGALPRLLDLDVEPGILSSALNLVIAQRLVRRLCKYCRKEILLNADQSEKIKKIVNDLPSRVKKPSLDNSIKIFAPNDGGCEKCNFMGYRGRVAIIELLEIDRDLQQAVSRRGKEMTVLEFRDLAVQQGMVEMLGDGVLKILSGMTSVNEVEFALGKFL